MANLRELRYDRGLQRQFVAKKVGICGKHLNDIEASKVSLTDNVAKRLSNLYELDVKEIRNMYEEGKNETIRGHKEAGPVANTN